MLRCQMRASGPDLGASHRIGGVAAAVALVLVAFLGAWGAQAQTLLQPVGRVNDFANVLSAPARTQLEALLKSLEDETHAEVAVATVESLEGISIEEYAARLFREWGIGQAALDNGVLVLVAPTEREIRIEVGYGLEPILPDALASAIIRDDFLPGFREGDVEAGLLRGVARVADVVRKKQVLTPEQLEMLNSSSKPTLFGWMLFGGLFLLWMSAVGMSALMFAEALKFKQGPSLLFSLVAIGVFAGVPMAFFARSAVVILPTALAVGLWGYRRRAPPLLRSSRRPASEGWDWSSTASSGSESDSSSGGSSSDFGGGSSGGGGASDRW